ncbi:tyrosine-type recombinase/integrase [Botrimarina hoheduenensis]|uniref:Site-specific tyrosine recombinase XerC n=1 Tax=Botrimarina hoheduenensis TaxID=2528000 RepID=A0A5C5VXN3_9BACT|nr:site-specific integrase [Botrimarina hoheduenensis]TWT42663.1 site-specific tyrosine recombinase XerC [Botrimarina hoheduenensis]
MPKRPSKAARPPRVPSYCLHRASGQAYVKVRGKVTYLGVHGSEASRTAYAAAVADVLIGREVQAPKFTASGSPHVVTVREVCDRFVTYARGYYVKSGKVTAEAGMVATACGHAAALFGDQPAEAFGPLALKAVRERMVAKGLARSTVNQSINRLRRAFRWAAGEELIPASIPAALAMVPGLRAGRTTARETSPVLPVADTAVDATVAELPEVVGDMVRLQRLTGMRPGEVCSLRPCDVDRSGEVWTYRPAEHKTQHHGRERVVFIGPKAQGVLLKYLARDARACCFRPCDSEARRRAEAHALRVTPLSCGNRPGSNVSEAPATKPGNRYSVCCYRQAITRACEKAGVDQWRPNQLRHTAATEVRARFGLEASQVVLGHSTARTSEIYAEKNLAAGAAVALAIG